MNAPAPREPADRDTVEVGSTDPFARRLLTAALALVVVGVLVAAGLAGWHARPRPLPAFSPSDLAGVYSGMVRGDGTNDATAVDANGGWNTDPADVRPAECAPLFATTVFNQLPAGVDDGMSTYWQSNANAVSLVTLRFTDAAAADADFAGIKAALDRCQGRADIILAKTQLEPVVVVSATLTQPAGHAPPAGHVKALVPPAKTVGYSYRSDGLFAVQVLGYANTVSWQFRYLPGTSGYDPVAAEQLMDGLLAQMVAVQELKAIG